ncbi:MAG: site-2 protease family protein [Mycobacteriales bacterium]
MTQQDPGTAPRRGVRIAQVAGVPIVLMPSWFLFAAYVVISAQSLLRAEVGSGRAYVTAVAFVLLLLASVVLHEVGHCLVARAFGLPVRAITVTLLAGLTEITEPPQTPAREYAVAISGPMVSLLLAGSGVAALSALAHGSLPWLLCAGVAVTNGAIAGLNLLPGLPLDGGRVLRSIVWHLGRDAERATRVSARAGMTIAMVVVPVVVIGVLPAVGVGDRGVGTVLISAMVGAFIYVGAAAHLRRSKVVSRLPGVSVHRLARPALAVPATTPLSEAVRQAHEHNVHALVVVDSSGRVEGVVSEAWVRQVPPERRPWVLVADGARRLEAGLLLDPSLRGEQLLAVMQRTPASEYVVPGPAPRVLVSADVAAAMQA